MPLLRRRWALRARKAAFNDAAVAAQTKTSERATSAKTSKRGTGDAAVGQGQVGLGEVRTEGSGSSVALSRRSQAANVRSQLSG